MRIAAATNTQQWPVSSQQMMNVDGDLCANSQRWISTPSPSAVICVLLLMPMWPATSPCLLHCESTASISAHFAHNRAALIVLPCRSLPSMWICTASSLLPQDAVLCLRNRQSTTIVTLRRAKAILICNCTRDDFDCRPQPRGAAQAFGATTVQSACTFNGEYTRWQLDAQTKQTAVDSPWVLNCLSLEIRLYGAKYVTDYCAAPK